MVTTNGAIPLYETDVTTFVWKIKSLTPIIDTIELSLITVINSFPNAGQMFLSACGKII